MTVSEKSFQKRVFQIGKELFDRVHRDQDSVNSLNKWTREIMEWCLSNPEVKHRVLQFVDVLPSLKSDKAITDHIRTYFSPSESRLPLTLRGGSLMTHTPFTGRAVSRLTHRMVTEVAQQFICGETIDSALQSLTKLEDQGLSYSLDILGETVTSEKEADRLQKMYMELIEKIPAGKNLSVKLSALTSRFDPLAFDSVRQDILSRLIPITELAKTKNTFINIDAEHFHSRDLTLAVTKKLLQTPSLKQYPHVGIVFQSYLQDTEPVLLDFLNWLKENKKYCTIRLVKGAYWDSEMAQAVSQGWPIPVWIDKGHTDFQFEKCTRILWDHREWIRTAIGSHNIRSIAHAIALQEEKPGSPGSMEFQLLYGMADPLKFAIKERGLPVRVYSPFGPLIPGMAYLVRRLLENTSNESFLKMDFSHEVKEKDLLKEPQVIEPASTSNQFEDNLTLKTFSNESAFDFSRQPNRAKIKTALHSVLEKLGGHYRLTINGHKIDSPHKILSINPSHPNQVIGTIAKAQWKDAEEAIRTARENQPDWEKTPVSERAQVLIRSAQIMRDMRSELVAWEILEAGKTWREADGDVIEAIDFLEFYGRSMIENNNANNLIQMPGEKNQIRRSPRGVVAVIAPWNFPLAILTGMTSAALVTGNTAIVKPAEPTGVLASFLVDILTSAGIPPGVVSFLPGSGGDIGKGLVRHPSVDMVAFTGSKEVGMSIIKQAGHTMMDQFNVKKVVAEMGGKNAIIIDEDADLDEAIKGVLTSAFGYQGQKCSACSRLILVEPIYHEFLDRLIEATRSLKTGDPQLPEMDLGPVIDLNAHGKIRGAIEEGKRQGRLVLEGTLHPSADPEGYFIPPFIFTDVPLNSFLCQEEIFGPVLSVFKARNFNDALLLANNTEFGLTAGIFSRNPKNIELAKNSLEAGNIYINRKITGAMVGRQPFGGYKMSGLGSKAGSIEYLSQFFFQTTITENTFRHGFPI